MTNKVILTAIDSLVKFFFDKNIIEEEDIDYCRHRIFNLLLINPEEDSKNYIYAREKSIDIIIKYAKQIGVIDKEGHSYIDDFLARLTDIFVLRPSEFTKKFYNDYSISPKKATDEMFKLNKYIGYIKSDGKKGENYWEYNGKYSKVQISINTAKPEKTIEEIELAKKQETSYPKCPICKENVGIGMVPNKPRAHHRIIPVNLNGRDFFFQYSPYTYFNEHVIVFDKNHSDMIVSEISVENMLEFVEQFPHYFLSSNADLPIVGGSILSHDHYQGGDHVFPIDLAEKTHILDKNDVDIYKVNWPVSTIRLESSNKKNILKEAKLYLDKWFNYTNKKIDIIAKTDKRHNTVNIVVRKIKDRYIVNLLLRNNRKNEEHPTGIFHTRKNLQAIKRENIGIIEVMGLAILPARLVADIKKMTVALENNISLNEDMDVYKEWFNTKIDIYNNLKSKIDPYNFIKLEIAKDFERILEDCGVFKMDENSQEILDEFIKA